MLSQVASGLEAPRFSPSSNGVRRAGFKLAPGEWFVQKNRTIARMDFPLNNFVSAM
jgi:hypothetical protein